jgi:hypothetical protein
MGNADGHAGRIELTDLRAPVLTDIQQAALQAAAAHPVTFTPEAVLQAAQAETDLSDFGADDFRPRLAVWLRAIDEDSNASALTRANLFQMTTRYAVTRLRLEDYIKNYPDCLDRPIERPIIVAGLPRSGTTYLLELLSADRRLRSLPWWEAIAPIPAPGDEPTASDPNPRHTRAAAGWQGYEAVLPYMKYMHSFSADHISEDIELQALDFSSYLIEWLAHVPRWRDFYLSQDQSGPYAYLRRAMQVLAHIRGPSRWVIKCPQHMEQLPVLLKTFPDATFVLTHRDPVGSIRSAMTMSLYAARILRQRVDPAESLAYWPDRYERLLRACVRDRDVLPAARTLDLYFHEWISHPEPVLREIYRLGGLPLNEQTLQTMRGAVVEGSNANGKLVYNLQRDFGISAEAIRERFGFYFDRFPVRMEMA